MKYALFAVALVLVLVGVTFCAPVPTVEVQQVQSTEYRPGYNPDNYKRPVREGNCWRQFTATDSILVCH